jgi:hypothetical protein
MDIHDLYRSMSEADRNEMEKLLAHRRESKNLELGLLPFPARGLPGRMTVLRAEKARDMDGKERDAWRVMWHDAPKDGGMLRQAWFAIDASGREWEYLGDVPERRRIL